MLDAIAVLRSRENVLAEAAGAAATAALIKASRPAATSVALVTGCNIPAHVLAQVVSRSVR
jgi:threonine dehydratase